MTQLVSVEPNAEVAEWDRMVGHATNASFCQTSTWGSVCERAFPRCRAAARLYRFDDGVEVLVPGMVETAAKGAIRAFRSVFPSDSGGMIGSAPLSGQHIDAIAADLKNAGFASVLIYESPFSVRREMPGFEMLSDFTHVLALTDGIDGVMRRMKYQERQSLRRAERCGVTIVERCDEQGVEQAYRLYKLSAERWGEKTTWLRPMELLRAAVEIGGQDVKLRLAMLGDVPIGAEVDYFHDTLGAVAWRAFDYEYRSCHPNVALFVASAIESCDRGLSYLDMGPSAGLPGLETMKDRYGAVRVGFRVWQWEHPAFKAYARGRKGFDRAQAAVRAATRR